jgi:hypothetical protein
MYFAGKTKVKIPNILESYDDGMSIQKLAELFETSKVVIRRVLGTNDITIRTQSEQELLNSGNGSLRHDAFDTITEESAYWIGFLYADGYVLKYGNRCLISIDLSTRDEGHLRKFATYLKSSNSICRSIRKREKGNYPTSKITISSKQLFDRLTTLGFDNTKTYTAVPPMELMNNVHFWRGVLDGDGWLTKTNSRQYTLLQVGICGTINTVKGFIDFIHANGIESTIESPRQKLNSPINYETNYGGNVAKKISTLLYKDATVYLDRKYEKYKEHFCMN